MSFLLKKGMRLITSRRISKAQLIWLDTYVSTRISAILGKKATFLEKVLKRKKLQDIQSLMSK